MALRENSLYQFKPLPTNIYVANWSNAWEAWVLKLYANSIVASNPAYYVTRHGVIVQASGYPSSWSLADLVYLGQKPP